MGLFDFWKKKEEQKAGLALDVGTHLIKALIFRIEEDGNRGTVIGVGREVQRLGDMQSGAVCDIEGVVKSCERAIEKAAETAGVAPDQVILGIAGELVKGSTTTIHYERLKPKTKIDFAELKNIIQKVQWKAFDKVRKQLSFETGMPEIDVKLINAAVVDVRIDGYRVTNPLGFQGKDVNISIFNAYAPLVHLGALQSISAELGLDLLSIAAEPYAVARCMGVEESIEFSAIFMDVGGGTTDIAVVRNGGLEGTKMFALGGRAFTKRLADFLSISFQEAEKIKIRYSQGKLDPELMKKIRLALETDLEVWLSGVELALEEFSVNDPLPSKILLCGGGSALTGLREFLLSDAWHQRLAFAKKPKIRFIQPKEVVNIIDATGRLNSSQDVTPMALANLALDYAGSEDVLGGLLRRAVKLMQS